ncbi:hypothetical protein [Actinomycetospora soli]|uniref:hypothetical protein n=1 Tax=Actinomycetospora soli TaxID=2893887 RepID=UPI001E45AA3E|nr:hypothetical protein [Actinomycetospora soli]MCD2190310.1 hypothetical protein [Actinomycetospora soli]
MATKRALAIDQEQRDLAVELTALALERAAPDEIVVLNDSAAEYFDDPESALHPPDRDEPLGAGIDVVMTTPYLLSAAGVVLPVLGAFAGDIAKDIAKDVVKEPLVRRIRALFRRGPGEPAANVPALTQDQALHVRGVVLEHARALGLPPGQATVIADATVGSLRVRS